MKKNKLEIEINEFLKAFAEGEKMTKKDKKVYDSIIKETREIVAAEPEQEEAAATFFKIMATFALIAHNKKVM